MKLSVSNIGWEPQNDQLVYAVLKKYNIQGLEIAPTRIFPDRPYEKLTEAEFWRQTLMQNYGLSIPSMQSIWFGRKENMFVSREERKILLNYTKQAINFAAAIGCGNLVFGCPKNRNLPEKADAAAALDFFSELGEYAVSKGTVIGMEANPAIYHTNYINDTASAIELVKIVNSNGFRLNLDCGTMIQNEESAFLLKRNICLINHVHISEPGLKPIEKRPIHQQLKELFLTEGYDGFVSVEMGKTDNVSLLEEKIDYFCEVFR